MNYWLLSLAACLAAAPVWATTYNTTLTFDSPVPLGATPAAGLWSPDRYRPAAFESYSFGGGNVLKVGINAVADGSTARAGTGQNGTFYNTQGRSLNLPAGTTALTAQLYVPSDWLAPSARRRTDLWGVAYNSANAASNYPIIGFANVDGTPVIRYWDETGNGAWVNTSVTPLGNTWYTFEIVMTDGSFDYLVNGVKVGTVPGLGATRLGNTMVEAYNFNDPALAAVQQSTESYEAYWDNLGFAYPQVRNVNQNTDYPTIQAAINAAASGEVIEVSPGIYTEAPISVNKAVTIQGPNAATVGSGARVAEATIVDTQLNVTAAAVIKGIKVLQTNTTQDAIMIQAAATIQNSILSRQGITTGNACRAITTSVGLTGVTISGNLFTGDSSGGFFSGHKTWQSGIYSNGGSATITGNTFENCRSALNLDDFNSGINLTGNTFRTCGTYVSFGGVTPTDGQYTITGNEFVIDFNNSLLPDTLFNNSHVAANFRINATGNTFGGIATTALSDSQKFTLEKKMAHRSSGKNGVVDYVAGEQIVVAGATTIASAINAAATANIVRIGPGIFTEDILVNKSLRIIGTGQATTTLIGTKDDVSMSTVSVAADNVEITGLYITRAGNTSADWHGALNSNGLATNSGTSGLNLHDCRFSGNRNALLIQAASGSAIRNNVITNNRTGVQFVNVASNLAFEENEVTGNWTVGILFRDEPGATAVTGLSFHNNNISANWYGQIVDRQAIVAPGTKNFERNWLGSTNPSISIANSTEPGYDAQIPVAFGGTAVAPGGQTDILGPASANVDVTPFLSSGTDTNVPTALGHSTYGFQGVLDGAIDGIFGDLSITTAHTYDNLYIAPNTIVTISPSGALGAGDFDLAPGATIVVNGGKLDLGQGSVISGTFTIFNSFGSWDINGDTTFNIGQNLALISDIHVAAGKTVTVNGGGELVLDGCIINSQTPGTKYNLTAATDGLLTVARCGVTDANIDINTVAASVPANLRSRVYDSSFTTSDIEASAASQVYHNLFDAATNSVANTDATAAFADIDTWGNVTSADALRNKFTLDFVAPVTTGCTLDAHGNLFVKPGDPVVMKMDVAALGSNTITGAEALLGYNSGMLALAGSPTRVTPLGNWEVIAETAPVPSGLGLVNSALGLQLNAGEEGISTTLPVQIANVNFTAGSPGFTVGFLRVQTNRVFDPAGTLVQDTRLTKSAFGVPSFLTAFTANTGDLVIDNQPPTIAAASVNGTQVQPSNGNVDVLNPTLPGPVSPNYVIRNGTPVILTFTATDAGLAGLETMASNNPTELDVSATEVKDDLVLTAVNGTTTLDAADYSVAAATTNGVVTYTVTLDVPVSAPNGTYQVSATVRDRSGNWSDSAALGSFQIENEVLATVELEGYEGATREVVFTATGGLVKTWTKNVAFTAALGSVPLEAVPAGTTAISAKTAWNLRSKLSVPFSPVGVGTVSLAGPKRLRGGDLNGDNVVNTLDYSILRYHWLSPDAVADITGNGVVDTRDYTLLQHSFYTAGDAQ